MLSLPRKKKETFRANQRPRKRKGEYRTKRKGCTHLRIASILVILLGAGSILAVRLLLGAEEAWEGLTEAALGGALWGITGTGAAGPRR